MKVVTVSAAQAQVIAANLARIDAEREADKLAVSVAINKAAIEATRKACTRIERALADQQRHMEQRKAITAKRDAKVAAQLIGIASRVQLSNGKWVDLR